ncbi:CRIB DOMAIN-CONTAINING PROTEIN RIC2 [Salix koriyanagi]|uniref:CRIB DOMAIN-CONTAINING PROTEIN RIC2 n=1 Tax=Salix koriyanagi TaxID=2511006 RepID=A0A9Q0W972_9ROSI|nr:CRIB DOMAIN-CONTAINING PROTEIN RIC2 [Salix koriyanagi]
MEKLVLLPFSIGCVSESRAREEDEESSSSTESTKTSLKFLAPSKPNVSTGFHKLVKAYKEEIEELEVEIEIGLPTNVKHVTHIGWDHDSPNTNPVQGWENLISTDLLSLQSATSRQFELVMAGQANSPLARASSA